MIRCIIRKLLCYFDYHTWITPSTDTDKPHHSTITSWSYCARCGLHHRNRYKKDRLQKLNHGPRTHNER